MRRTDVGGDPARGGDRVLTTHQDVGGVERDPERVRPGALDERDHLARGDLLVSLEIEVRAVRTQRGRQEIEHARRRHELVRPRDVRPKAVAGEDGPVAELVVARRGPQVGDPEVGQRAHEPHQAPDVVAVPVVADLRQLRRGERVDLADAHLHVETEPGGHRERLTHLADVEGRRQLPRRAQEHPVQAVPGRFLERPRGSVSQGARELAGVGADPHHASSCRVRSTRPRANTFAAS